MNTRRLRYGCVKPDRRFVRAARLGYVCFEGLSKLFNRITCLVSVLSSDVGAAAVYQVCRQKNAGSARSSETQ